MAREIEARLKINAIDKTANAFESVERRFKHAAKLAAKASRQNEYLDRVEATADGVNTAILQGGAAIVGGFSVAGGLNAIIDSVTEYENALVEVRKKGGLTVNQMREVGEEARALATSGDLAVPLNEIIAAYERGAAAGLPLDELKEFATLSAKAGDSFEMTAEDVGNAAAGFKVSLGIPISEMEKYFDLINGLADSGIANESDLINFLDRAGASLKLFGLSAQEAAAYGATLANIKMAPDVAANALSTLTGKLLSPGSKKAEGALKAIVGDVGLFQKLLKTDANGALMQFLDKIKELDKFKATELLGSFLGAGFDDEIFRLAQAVEEARRNLDYAAGGDWFGSLSKSYSMKLETLSSQWQLFQNQVEELSIDVGMMGLPALKAGLESVRGVVVDIGRGIDTFGLEIDQGALNQAAESLGNMATAVASLTGADVGDSQIIKFFSDLARLTNEIAAVVPQIDRLQNFIRNPLGVDSLAYDAKDSAGKPLTTDILGGSIQVEKGGWVDRLTDSLGSFATWADSRHEAAQAAAITESATEASTRRIALESEATSTRSALTREDLTPAQSDLIRGDLRRIELELASTPDSSSTRRIALESEATSTRSALTREDLTPAQSDLIRSDLRRIELELASTPDGSSPALDSFRERQARFKDSRITSRIDQSTPVSGSGTEERVSQSGPLGADLDIDLQGSTDRLRQAMEASGVTIAKAGSDAGANAQAGLEAGADAISVAAQDLTRAANAIGEQGRAAAAAISSVRIPLPNGLTAARRPNADLGQTMPTAGTPGG